MRLECPYCGERDAREFTYSGDATSVRPDPSAPAASLQFFAALYLRDNPAGVHRELWYHTYGCRGWLSVTRNTLTHEILGVSFASPAR